MAEKAMKRFKAHQRYYAADGDLVPGVTTILNVLNKPALVGWANRMGLQGIDTNKYVDAKAEIGTCAHYLIECDLTGEKPDLSEHSPSVVDQAENALIKWYDWRKGKQLDLILSEAPLVSNRHRFGGTIDIFADLDGVKTLIDIKTSGSGIWPEMKHQVSAYRELLVENGHQVERVLIVRVGRDESEGFETATVSNLDQHFDLFLHALVIYNLQKVLK